MKLWNRVFSQDLAQGQWKERVVLSWNDNLRKEVYCIYDSHSQMSSVPKLLGFLGTAPGSTVEKEKWADIFPSTSGLSVSSSRYSSAADTTANAPERRKRRESMDDISTPLLTMDPSEFDGYYAQLQAFALKATKNAAALPADLAFHRSVDSDLANDLETCSNKVTSITNMLLDFASTIGSSKSAKGKEKARVRDEDDFLDRFASLIVEPMDQLFERAVFVVFCRHLRAFLLTFFYARISRLTRSPEGRKHPPLLLTPQSLKKRKSAPKVAKSQFFNMFRISQNRSSSLSGRPTIRFPPCAINSTRVYH